MKMNKTQLDAIYQRAEEYYYGKNGKKSDTAKALELYRQAAEQGHAEALYELGAALKMPGEYQNTREAVKWLRKAAEQGHQEAQAELGHSYEFGVGVEIDLKEAEKWYHMSQEEAPVANKKTKSTPSALYKKGREYYKTQDYTNAFLCFEQAAEQGHADAQYFLALCYQDGTGVEKNKKMMWKWYYAASDNGNMIARGLCELRNEKRREKEKREEIYQYIIYALVAIAAIASWIWYS